MNTSPASKVVERPKTTSFVDVSKIVGRDKNREDLLRFLKGEGSKEENQPHVISLVGMGGIGKTTLAQLVYNDPEVKAHFDKRIWVCVSEPFDQRRIAKAIIESLAGVEPCVSELQSLMEEICRLIGGKKFFLVLDDVWTEDFKLWEPFRNVLQNGAQGSRILVTTRNGRVAVVMGARSIELEKLSDEDCWLVFSKIAFFDKDPQSQRWKELEDIGREISKKCKGLPLAAETLGSLMRFKSCSKQEWEEVLDSDWWKLENVESGIFVPLLLSYYDLPSPLKRCFSYCAVFPKDFVFSGDDLVLMWMAQGYIDSKEPIEMEVVAREYLQILAIRSCFQNIKKGEDDDEIKWCKMHDIVHDFAQFLTKNECFAVNNDIKLGSDYKNARHLYLEFEGQFSSFYCATNLRTLIFNYRTDNDLSPLFQHFKCLRTLNLTYPFSELNELPDAIGDLIHLRYLKIDPYNADELPETICNLCNLQTLEIITTNDRFKKLPQGMSKLINLRNLILSVSFSIPFLEFPRGIGRSVSLRRLSHFSVSGKDDINGCKLRELENLDHLQGTLKIEGLGNVLDACEAKNAQLKKKRGLRDLNLSFVGENHRGRKEVDVSILKGLEPPKYLENLSIIGYKGTTMFPNWMMFLTQLKMLTIKSSSNLECLPPLGKLLFLESLYIETFYSLKKVGVEFLGIESEKKKRKDDVIEVFPNLKYLTFKCLSKWEEWIGIGGEEEEDCITIMPRLQKLEICQCPMLKLLPDFLHTIPLRELWMNGNRFSANVTEEEQERTGPRFPAFHTSRLILWTCK